MYACLPMYQKIGQSAYRANLDNTLLLDTHLNHPHLSFKTIHVAKAPRATYWHRFCKKQDSKSGFTPRRISKISERESG